MATKKPDPVLTEMIMQLLGETARADSIIAGQLPAPNPRGRFLGPDADEAHAQALVDQQLVEDRRNQRARANQLAMITPRDATGNSFKKGLVSSSAGDADFTDEDLNVLFSEIMQRLITAEPDRFTNEDAIPTVMRIFGEGQGRGSRERLAMFGSPSNMRRQREVSEDPLLNDAIDELVRDALASKSGSPFDQMLARGSDAIKGLSGDITDAGKSDFRDMLTKDRGIIDAVQAFFESNFAGGSGERDRGPSRADAGRAQATRRRQGSGGSNASKEGRGR